MDTETLLWILAAGLATAWVECAIARAATFGLPPRRPARVHRRGHAGGDRVHLLAPALDEGRSQRCSPECWQAVWRCSLSTRSSRTSTRALSSEATLTPRRDSVRSCCSPRSPSTTFPKECGGRRVRRGRRNPDRACDRDPDEGFAAAAPLLTAGHSRRSAIGLAALTGAVEPPSALLALATVQHRCDLVPVRPRLRGRCRRPTRARESRARQRACGLGSTSRGVRSLLALDNAFS